MRFFDGYAACLGPAAAKLAKNVADIDCTHLGTRHSGYLEHRQAAGAGLDLDLYFLVVEFARPQLLPEALTRGGACTRTDQRIEDAFFRRLLGTRLNVLAFSLAHQRDSDLDQIAHNLL